MLEKFANSLLIFGVIVGFLGIFASFGMFFGGIVELANQECLSFFGAMWVTLKSFLYFTLYSLIMGVSYRHLKY